MQSTITKKVFILIVVIPIYAIGLKKVATVENYI